ncbi:metal ABC transporter ATP-binding protein [Corynebacterium spheniscorum]|uniref:ABC-type Mn2+/Zn2+ transport system, ATPase component n=1 Tax=Corynebacterium spheniscorum TaxID=185761 RepID=A0A1I2PSF3_9CORY|nr:metal ABC transporter ATP-binding protein [Corynebacterium spheniscorum]KAA8723398.1 metal ABC transporter ATP-binding protein [Corynebacterium spheniscorum]SFG18303.1 ABC-type Mn2+/Zn2+ transport system, ATPase component [Corynebacterium spheniscorum]
MSVVSFEDASFSYGGPPALTGITLSLEPGQALALVGSNGSGKTTLMRGILGMVRVDGKYEVVEGRGSIGYVPQSADIDLSFPVSVRQVVSMGCYAKLGFLRRFRDHGAVKHALERVGLADRIDYRFGDLSGGQRQRVMVARAIVADPKLILLDEPFNGLDQTSRGALLRIIDELKAEGVAMVVSTHDEILAREVCELTAVLDGRLVAFGPTQEVLAEHAL